MCNSKHKWIVFLGLAAIFFLPISVFCEISIVPIGKVFRLEEPVYTKEGLLVIPGSNKRYKANDIREDRRHPGEKFLVLSLTNSNKSYLMDESYLSYDHNVVVVGDGRIIMIFQTGGNHCCSTFVCMLKDDKTGELKVGGSKTIDHPELAVSRETIRHIDPQGNISIEVRAFTDRYDDEIENSGYYPTFTYYIKVLKDGNIIVDKNVESYEVTINKLKDILSKSYDFETYVQLVFYNRILKLKLSESAYLAKASDTEKGVAVRGVKWLFDDLEFLKLVELDDFVIKQIAPK